jgi:hypothetical protein
MRDLMYLGIVAIFSVATWGLLVLFEKLLGGKK